MRDFQRAMAQTLCGLSEVYHVLDSTLIPAIVRVRASRKSLSQEPLARGSLPGRLPSGGAPPRPKVGLRVQGGAFGKPAGRDLCAFGLAEASSEERPIGEYLIIEDSHDDAYLAYPRVLRAFSGSDAGRISVWSVGGGPSQGQLQEGVAGSGSPLGLGKAADHRRGQIEQLSRTSWPWSATEPRRFKAFWPAWRPRWRPTPAGSGSTTSSGDRCGIWPTSWSEQLCITRLRSCRRPSLQLTGALKEILGRQCELLSPCPP